jgi:hypothetical protein
MVRGRSLEGAEILSADAFLKECSNLVLLICLRFENLSNLERSRLLNILLLSGDLQLRLCQPLVKNGGSVSDLSSIFLERPSKRLKNPPRLYFWIAESGPRLDSQTSLRNKVLATDRGRRRGSPF